MEVKVKAYAKINLMLDIVNRRNDGYHDLFMIMQSVSVYDTITVTENKSKSISITCNIDDIPLNNKNIAWKAAEAFFEATKKKNKGINIDIVKRIPHAAGLAGGSADGAAVLVALNKIYKTELSETALCRIGVKIGADVNTAFAYKQFDLFGKTHTPDKLGMLCAVQSRDLDAVCSKMENVFEQFIEVPNRINIKEVIKNNNAKGFCMSGSGPTVFGIFENKEDAVKASEELKEYAKDIMICKPVNKGCKIVE